MAVKLIQKGDAGDSAKAYALKLKRARVLENYEDALYDRSERDARLAVILEAEGKLQSLRWVKLVSLPVGLDEDPVRVNAYLRKLIERVDLDAVTGLPVAFAWRDPSLRVEHPIDDTDAEGRVLAGHELR